MVEPSAFKRVLWLNASGRIIWSFNSLIACFIVVAKNSINSWECVGIVFSKYERRCDVINPGDAADFQDLACLVDIGWSIEESVVPHHRVRGHVSYPCDLCNPLIVNVAAAFVDVVSNPIQRIGRLSGKNLGGLFVRKISLS